MSGDDCRSLIEEGIKTAKLSNKCIKGSEQFSQGSLGRQDVQLQVPRLLDNWYNTIQDPLFDCLSEYTNQISSCADLTLVSPTFKWQWTPVGGGYSMWHIEQGAGATSNRVLAWMMYLNDVTDGGETEFLYQHQRINPEVGKIVIWPAGVTHPHRGNPPYSNDKFVVTGWFEVAPNDMYCQALDALKEKRQNNAQR